MEIVLGIADGGIEVWKYIEGPFMGNIITTKRFPNSRENLWVDSGGFQALRKGMKLSINYIIESYRRIDAEVYMALDQPPSMDMRYSNDEWKNLIKKNIRLYEELRSKFEEKCIVPIVHHYPADKIFEVVDFYKSVGASMLAIGGSVPGLLNRGHRKYVTLLGIILIRKIWNRKLHVLGAGSPVMSAIMNVVGADSADTASWRVKAAFGKIIIPGAGERYVGKRNIRYGPLLAKEHELINLEKHLRKTRFPLLDGKPISTLLTTFKGRAIINAWIMKTAPLANNTRGYKWLIEKANNAKKLTISELMSLYSKLRGESD